MQNPELSILNAESFDDCVPGFHAPRSLPPAERARVAGEDSGKSRKRTKTQAVDTCEQEEEEKKRSRGRPRLDTNDETAKDVSMVLLLRDAMCCFSWIINEFPRVHASHSF